MSGLLLHLTAVERLAAHASQLPPEFSKALAEDLEYARFGAALPHLPWFDGLTKGVGAFVGKAEVPRFTELLTREAPVAFGLKAAELVANGALVGTEAGLAFLAGYFAQVCVSRATESITTRLISRHRRAKESEAAARVRIEWAQSLLFMQELHGEVLVGTNAVRAKLHVRKASAAQGIGRGLYELIRVCSAEALPEVPTKQEMDRWLRGLYVFSLALGSPLGRLKVGTPDRAFYRGEGIDVWGAVEAGLERTRQVIHVLGGMLRRGSFTSRAKAKVFALLPEGPPSVGLAQIQAA